ncbi:MAG: anti-sigma factor antagonist [Chlamydiae bacterium CG10_big_fil_rev_8_21_14_0_10_35_9]|nr:MAG: anti-sigma factor antagonist [Chlamydiae bacterium CG10_big_fil_rev_8_21_14_0_10_35_9]
MAIGLNVQIEEIEGVILMKIEGRLDAPSTPILEKKLNALIDDGRFQIMVDFARVDYLSSAGLRLLLAATKKLKSHEGKLVLFSIPDEVMEIIKLAGFQRILTICTNEQEALQSF